MLYYRAHEASGNTAFVHALADAVDATGQAVGVPVFAGSLRAAADDLYDALGTLDALVVTVLAAGGSAPSTASAGGDDEAWDVARMAALDIPVIQGLCLTSSRTEWLASDDGVSPLDSATQIAIPEFDGRIITAPFSFKEVDADGLPHYVADPERCDRVARIAVNHARLRSVPNTDKRLALVLSAYPTKHARIGNAVGLDTPVSAIRLLRRLRDAGCDLGSDNPVVEILDRDGTDAGADTRAGDALIHALIAAGYEIHHGRITVGSREPFLGGARDGLVFGTMWHGSLEGDELRRSFLAEALGLGPRPCPSPPPANAASTCSATSSRSTSTPATAAMLPGRGRLECGCWTLRRPIWSGPVRGTALDLAAIAARASRSSDSGSTGTGRLPGAVLQ